MSIDEGKGLNPYFEGLFDGESDELRALRLTLWSITEIAL